MPEPDTAAPATRPKAAAAPLRTLTATSTPCSDPECNTAGNGEPCERHEREHAHAEDEHELCGLECEVILPSEQIRNAILCQAIPGSPAMLAELERRAEQPPAATAADPWPVIARLTAWLDHSNGHRTPAEVALRLLKVTEEAGEVAQAWIGVTGQNPRKGVTHTTSDVADELCDVITAAMVALMTITPDPGEHFTRKVQQIAALRLNDLPAENQEHA